jgi:hypothetical protein
VKVKFVSIAKPVLIRVIAFVGCGIWRTAPVLPLSTIAFIMNGKNKKACVGVFNDPKN